MTLNRRVPTRSGVGLRLPHLAEIVATRPRAAWLEIHAENFLANAHATELLTELARDCPISVHTVGVSVGSAGGIDRVHLARVRALVELIDPILVSGHLAWSTHEGEYLNDLLPLPYDEETLHLIARHIDEVQSGLGRVYLVENPSSYVRFGASTMTETEFLGNWLAARAAGCFAMSVTSISARTTSDSIPTLMSTSYPSRPSASFTWAGSRPKRTKAIPALSF